MTEPRTTPDNPATSNDTADNHVCKPGATTYYCPTAGEVESDCHGGFDVCCDKPELHRPVELREQYAAAINAKIDGTEGCANGHRLADAILAVRDREMERLKLLVAASGEPGQAVRMAAQYADRAIENGKRAEEAEAERNRVQQAACRTAENLRKAEARVAELEKLLADELTALDQPQQPTTTEAGHV